LWIAVRNTQALTGGLRQVCRSSTCSELMG